MAFRVPVPSPPDDDLGDHALGNNVLGNDVLGNDVLGSRVCTPRSLWLLLACCCLQIHEDDASVSAAVENSGAPPRCSPSPSLSLSLMLPLRAALAALAVFFAVRPSHVFASCLRPSPCPRAAHAAPPAR